jgi:drug/metabolite transporter (DMT)-like permease
MSAHARSARRLYLTTLIGAAAWAGVLAVVLVTLPSGAAGTTPSMWVGAVLTLVGAVVLAALAYRWARAAVRRDRDAPPPAPAAYRARQLGIASVVATVCGSGLMAGSVALIELDERDVALPGALGWPVYYGGVALMLAGAAGLVIAAGLLAVHVFGRLRRRRTVQ